MIKYTAHVLHTDCLWSIKCGFMPCCRMSLIISLFIHLLLSLETLLTVDFAALSLVPCSISKTKSNYFYSKVIVRIKGKGCFTVNLEIFAQYIFSRISFKAFYMRENLI